MCPNTSSVWQFWGWKGALERLPPLYRLCLTTVSSSPIALITTPSPSMPCHTVSNSPIALMPPLHHTCPTTQSLGASSPIALKASESSPPVAAFLISQLECLGGGLNAGRPLVGAFNFTSGWGKRMWLSKYSISRSINRSCNSRKSPGVLKMLPSGFQGVWIGREAIIVTSHWSGWG